MRPPQPETAAPAPRARKPVAAARGRGRPAAQDALQLRTKILDAAADEFARAGLDGARVERIAEQADVNVRMLYYYFDSKDGLFLAVLERIYAQIRAAERALALDRLEPVEAMRELVRFTWQYYFRHPELIALLNSENQHEGRHLAGSASVAQLHAPLLALIGRVLRRGERSGVFRKRVDPMQLYISIAALGYFYVSNRYTLSAFFERDLMAGKQLDARLVHMTDMVLAYLRPQ